MQLHECLSGREFDVNWRSSEAEMLLASLLRVFASSEPRARQNRVFSRQRRAFPPHQRAKSSNYPDPTRAAGREKTVFHKRTRVLARHSINGPPQKKYYKSMDISGEVTRALAGTTGMLHAFSKKDQTCLSNKRQGKSSRVSL